MTSRTRVLSMALALLMIAAVGCASSDSEPAPQPDEESSTPSGVLIIEATIRGGEVSTADERVEITLGETVRLVILSDSDDELHVHGYDLKRPLIAGKELTLEFVADIPGVFEVELEDTGLNLFELRVQ